MALIKQKKIEYIGIDMIRGNIDVRKTINIIDDSINKVEVTKSKNVKIKARDNVTAQNLGLLNICTKIWDYLNL